jgi:hypothetical protein
MKFAYKAIHDRGFIVKNMQIIDVLDKKIPGASGIRVSEVNLNEEVPD